MLDFQSNTQRQLQLAAMTLKLERFFKEEGIEVLHLKGPALAEDLYGSVLKRYSRDIDLLVTKKTATFIYNFFLSQGYGCYEPSVRLTPRQFAFYLKNSKDFIFYHPVQKILIEVHFAWSVNPYLFTLPLEEAFAQAVMVDLNGHTLKTLHPLHQLLFLCLHGAQHVWSEPKWLLDIVAWQKKYGETFSSYQLVAAAKKFGVLRCVCQAFVLAHHRHGSILPVEIAAVIAQDPTIKKLVQIANKYEAAANIKEKTRWALLSGLLLNPCWRSKWAQLKYYFGMNYRYEFETIHLNDRFFWLYHWLHPFLWCYRQFRKRLFQ